MCGDVRYALTADPITLYVCHCTDCQSESGASFTLSMIIHRESLEVLQGDVLEYSVELPDGRRKGAQYCGRCMTLLFFKSSVQPLAAISPGTLDYTTWLRPAGHIWTRSAQPWLEIPADVPHFEQQPGDAGMLELVRIWKSRG